MAGFSEADVVSLNKDVVLKDAQCQVRGVDLDARVLKWESDADLNAGVAERRIGGELLQEGSEVEPCQDCCCGAESEDCLNDSNTPGWLIG